MTRVEFLLPGNAHHLNGVMRSDSGPFALSIARLFRVGPRLFGLKMQRFDRKLLSKEFRVYRTKSSLLL